MKGNKDGFLRELMALVLPIAAQNLMSSVVSASDAVMLGVLDQASLSAVSLATQVTFVLSLFYAAYTIGATVLAAQYWGKGDGEAVEHVTAIGLRYTVFVSLVFFAAALGIPGLLMRIFTNDPELIARGSVYLRIVSFSYLFMGISQLYLVIMKNSGRTARSTVYSSAAMVLNVIFNAVLIFGLFGIPRMDIAGAALATVLARVIEFVICLTENRKPGVIRMRTDLFLKPRTDLGGDFRRYTAPVLANELFFGGALAAVSAILGHLGSDAVAANSLANIVKSILLCVCLGIATGSGILIGNALGSGDLKKAKDCGDRILRLAFIAGAVSGLAVLAVSPFVVHFSTSLTETARGYLRVMLWVCSYYMIGKSVNCTVVAGIFTAGGDTRFGMWNDLVCMWFIIVPAGLAAAFLLKLPVLAVYLILNLDETVKLVPVLIHYRKYRWLKDLTRDEG